MDDGDQRCFPQTRQGVTGRIREFWEQNGGLPGFGYPIAPSAKSKMNPDGNGQRALSNFVGYHPAHDGEPDWGLETAPLP